MFLRPPQNFSIVQYLFQPAIPQTYTTLYSTFLSAQPSRLRLCLSYNTSSKASIEKAVPHPSTATHDIGDWRMSRMKNGIQFMSPFHFRSPSRRSRTTRPCAHSSTRSSTQWSATALWRGPEAFNTCNLWRWLTMLSPIHGFPKPDLETSRFPLLQTSLITSMTGLKYWLEIYTELVNLNYIATNDLWKLSEKETLFRSSHI